MDTLSILFGVLSVVTLVVGALLSMVLFRVYTLLQRAENILDYIEHIKGTLQDLEMLPARIVGRIIRLIFREK